jgi:3-keto-disaccharide hydrolase
MPRVLPAAARFVALTFAVFVSGNLVMLEGQGMPTLTPQERAAGWKLLFDGKSLAGWRGFKSETPSAGWKAVDGVLFREAGDGDLLTTEQFGDFELSLEWKLEKGGNSGIFFRVIDEGDFGWWSGPEVQVLDNAVHKDGKNPLTSAGSNYAVHAPVKDVTKPIGEWNAVRLIVKGAHVEHWLNGVKIVEYELWSPDWEARVKSSKFGKIPMYGRAKRGRIGLQDHGDPVWYRNIKIKPLST